MTTQSSGNKSSLPHDDAVASIVKDSGTKFDPQVVEAFYEVHTLIRLATTEPTKEQVAMSI